MSTSTTPTAPTAMSSRPTRSAPPTAVQSLTNPRRETNDSRQTSSKHAWRAGRDAGDASLVTDPIAPVEHPSSRRMSRHARLTEGERQMLRDIGVRITAARKRKRLTRAQFSVLTDINIAHVGSLERGVENPTALTLYRVARALDVTVASLVERTGRTITRNVSPNSLPPA
jgi:DNA-binding transcriptional regulator YiaG